MSTDSSSRNDDELMSILWPRFASHKVSMEEWKRTEADATKTTLRHWLECCGDKQPGDYTTEDAFAFHAMMKELSSNYGDHQIRTLFPAPKFMGAKSAHYWKQTGPLVIRDHRYWLPLIGAPHGNRREEPMMLQVEHVRRTAAGIAYFS